MTVDGRLSKLLFLFYQSVLGKSKKNSQLCSSRRIASRWIVPFKVISNLVARFINICCLITILLLEFGAKYLEEVSFSSPKIELNNEIFTKIIFPDHVYAKIFLTTMSLKKKF